MERLSLILTVTLVIIGVSESYKIGLGRADVTGPSVEIAFVSFFSAGDLNYVADRFLN